MLGLLNEIEEAGEEAVSLCLPPGLPRPQVEGMLEKALVPQVVIRDMVEYIARSGTGAFLFWGSSRKFLVLPPFPVTARYIAPGYNIEPLRSQLEENFSIALVLVRLGAYAIGVCQGEKLIASKTGTGLIHARHKKGGSSQRRFERRRENQIDFFLKRVCSHIREHLEPHAQSLDYLVYGGARTTLHSLREQCPFLQKFENRSLPPLLNIPQPRKSVLERAIGTIWSSSVTEWYDSDTPGIDSQTA
jgi:hypothetical protein